VHILSFFQKFIIKNYPLRDKSEKDARKQKIFEPIKAKLYRVQDKFLVCLVPTTLQADRKLCTDDFSRQVNFILIFK